MSLVYIYARKGRQSLLFIQLTAVAAYALTETDYKAIDNLLFKPFCDRQSVKSILEVCAPPAAEKAFNKCKSFRLFTASYMARLEWNRYIRSWRGRLFDGDEWRCIHGDAKCSPKSRAAQHVLLDCRHASSRLRAPRVNDDPSCRWRHSGMYYITNKSHFGCMRIIAMSDDATNGSYIFSSFSDVHTFQCSKHCRVCVRFQRDRSNLRRLRCRWQGRPHQNQYCQKSHLQMVIGLTE